MGSDTITENIASQSLLMLGINAQGLDELDQRLLSIISDQFAGGPVGIDTLAAIMGEDKGTLEDVIEPYLIQKVFLIRSPRGRMLPQV